MDDAPPVFDKAFWDERYRSHSHSHVWSGNPNPQLVAEVLDLPAGAALEVGAGEGADAVWLAERGWKVTAVDLSTVGLDRAAAHAAERGDEVAARIEWVAADVTEWVPPIASYDLVTSQFMHLPSAERSPLIMRLAAALRSGGVLLVVGHHPSDLQTSIRRPKLPDLMFTAEDVAALLPAADWEIGACEARGRTAVDADGTEVTIHDSVLRATRR